VSGGRGVGKEKIGRTEVREREALSLFLRRKRGGRKEEGGEDKTQKKTQKKTPKRVTSA